MTGRLAELARRYDDVIETIDKMSAYGITEDDTDQSAAFQAMIDQLDNVTIDGKHQTIRIDNQINLKSNIRIKNLTIDARNTEAGTYVISAEGSLSAAVDVTSDITFLDKTISIADASELEVGEYVYVLSDKMFSASSNHGEIQKIEDIDGNNVTFYGLMLHSYDLADNARIQKMNPVVNVELQDVHILGENDSLAAIRGGMRFNITANTRVVNCSINGIHDRQILFDRSIHFVVDNHKGSHAGSSGTGYGVTISRGCHYGIVSNSFFEDMRHNIALGGSFCVNRYITVENCTFYGARDALDSHDASEFITFHNNTIEGFSRSSVTSDGIIVQGVNCTITDNTVINPARHGIVCQMLSVDTSGKENYVIITGNKIIRTNGDHSTKAQAISVRSENTDVHSITISGNRVLNAERGFGVLVDVMSGSPLIGSVSLVGNNFLFDGGSFNGVIEITKSQHLIIQANNIIASTLLPNLDGIRIGSDVESGLIVGNIFSNFGRAIAGTGTDKVYISENLIKDCSVNYSDSIYDNARFGNNISDERRIFELNNHFTLDKAKVAYSRGTTHAEKGILEESDKIRIPLTVSTGRQSVYSEVTLMRGRANTNQESNWVQFKAIVSFFQGTNNVFRSNVESIYYEGLDPLAAIAVVEKENGAYIEIDAGVGDYWTVKADAVTSRGVVTIDEIEIIN